MAYRFVRPLAALAFSGLVAACMAAPAWSVEPDGPTSLISAEMAEKLKFAKTFKSILLQKDQQALPFTVGLSNFYAERGYEPVWIKNGQFSSAIESGIAVLISPASSMKRVFISNSRAFQVR